MLSLLRLLHEEEEEENDNGGTNNIIIKVASLVFLLGMAIGFGFMPFFITSCRKSNKFLSLSNAFSGGIFLGMGLFHILPESVELLEETTKFPLGYVCCFLSYALILFVEKIAFNSHAIVHGAHHHEGHHSHENIDQDIEVHQNHGKQNDKEEHIESENKVEAQKREQVLVVNMNLKKDKEISSSRNIVASQNELNKVENNANSNSISKGGLSSYLLLLALGFHGLFEGISLGIQSTIRGTLFLLLAIALHKWAASLTLGISFVKAGVNKKQFIIMILIFAFITPIGIALGMALTSLSNNTVAGIFLSISVGTFIYIACSEVVIDEFANPEYKYPKFLCFLLGAAVVIALTLVEVYTSIGHNHAHGHEHKHEHED